MTVRYVGSTEFEPVPRARFRPGRIDRSGDVRQDCAGPFEFAPQLESPGNLGRDDQGVVSGRVRQRLAKTLFARDGIGAIPED